MFYRGLASFMHRESRILLLATLALALVAEAPQSTTETFVWRHGTHIVGRLSVPKGSAVEVYDYHEGIVTTLRYGDGAYIVLQVGGMHRLPLFQGPEYKLVSSTERDTKTTRAGQFLDAELYWREDNYRHRKFDGNRFSWLAMWPPNIGYAKVRSERRMEFDNALDSFLREVDRTRSSHDRP